MVGSVEGDGGEVYGVGSVEGREWGMGKGDGGLSSAALPVHWEVVFLSEAA